MEKKKEFVDLLLRYEWKSEIDFESILSQLNRNLDENSREGEIENKTKRVGTFPRQICSTCFANQFSPDVNGLAVVLDHVSI